MATLKNRMLSGLTLGAFLGTAGDIYGTVSTFNESRKQGDNMPVTLAKTAVDFGIGAALNWKQQLLYFGATAGYDMTIGASKQNAELQNKMKYTGSGRVGSGYFNMSGAGYTMRQRAINQLRMNGQNVNAVLGNEARNYVKSSQNYS